MRISDWSSDVCSSDLLALRPARDALILTSSFMLHRIDQRLVAPEQMLDPVAVRGEGLTAIKAVDREIERVMRLPEIGRHRIGIVEISEARRRPRRPRVEHILRQGSEEHTSEHQSLMRISSAVFCLKK